MVEPIFVAREAELNRLQTFLDQAFVGQAQVCLVAGDAGAGKSALLAEFARRAQADKDTLLVAVGECNAQTGLGDPFLPFREILAQLSGDTDTKVAGGKITAQNAARLSNFVRVSGRTLVEVAPDIIGTLIPGGSILAKAATFAAEKAGWLEVLEKKVASPPTKLDEKMIFQQLANLLAAWAKEQPLLLILDDLQWADQASIALLFHLSRALNEARVLIVGAYRPSDIALGRGDTRHPLEATLNEIKRYRGDVLIDLNETSEARRKAFVEALVDSEPNHLSTDFRAALFAQTGGYPLFTVELLRDLQERGDLVWDEAALGWTQPGALDWDDLPARVEGVIQERIGRLAENLRDILTTASVEGMQFTTQVVARVHTVTERNLLKSLSDELERRHHLVQEGDEEKVGKARLWHYQFSHIVFQKYLYDDLSRGERRLLHGEVARILEDLYAEHADTIAVQLARHYDEAGEDEQAAYYYKRAGEQAAAIYGNAEAIQHFSRALELTPDSDAAAYYNLYRAREAIYDLQGAREAQRPDIAAQERLAEALKDDARRAQAALRRAHYCTEIADYAGALAAAQRAILCAQALGAGDLEAEGHVRQGSIYSLQGNVSDAQTELEQSLALARSLHMARLEVDSLNRLAHLQFYQGKIDQAQTYYEEALRMARDLGDQRRESNVLGSLASVVAAMGDAVGGKTYLLESIRVARHIGDRTTECGGLGNLGVWATALGDYSEAQAYVEQGLQLSRLIEDGYLEISAETNMSMLLFCLGNYAGGVAYAEHAVRAAHDLGLLSRESYALAVAGLIRQAQGDYPAALEQALAALAIAEALHDPFEEQFAAGVVAHALVGLGRLDEAADFYRRALAVLLKLVLRGATAEMQAGLARIALAQANIPGALAQIEAILPIDPQGLADANELPRIYLTCYNILKAAHDSRAGEVLYKGYEFLQTRAAKITDEAMRRSYLANVPYNRDLIAAWQTQSSSKA